MLQIYKNKERARILSLQEHPANQCLQGVVHVKSLFDVFPVGLVQTPGDEKEDEQQYQDRRSNAFALSLVGLGHPAQEIAQVGNIPVKAGLLLGIDRSDFDRGGFFGVSATDRLGLYIPETVLIEQRGGFNPLTGVVLLDLDAFQPGGPLGLDRKST